MKTTQYIISIFLFSFLLNPLYSQTYLLLEEAVLDAKEGYLWLRFSEPLDPNYTSTTASLVLYPSLGTVTDKIIFTAPLNTVPGTENNTAFIYLDNTQLLELERFSGIGEKPLLDISEGSFGSQAGNINQAYVGYEVFTKEDEIFPDSTRFFLDWAHLNLSRGFLELYFNNPRDMNIELNSGILLFNQSFRMELSQNEFQIESHEGSNQLILQLGSSQLETLKNSLSSGSELFLAFSDSLSMDIYGNALRAESEFFVEYQSQIHSLELYWVQLNWEQDLLELEFNNKVIAMNVTGSNPLKFETRENSLELVNPEFIDNVTEDYRTKIKIAASQLDSVQRWPNLENELFLNIPEGIFEDEFGNKNLSLRFEVNRPRGDSLHFHLTWAAIDPIDGVLFLEYNNPVDLSSLSSSSVIHIYKNGTALLDIENLQNRLEASNLDRVLIFKLDAAVQEMLKPDSNSFFEIGIAADMIEDMYGNLSPEEFRRPLNYNHPHHDPNRPRVEYYPYEGKIVFQFPFRLDDSKTNMGGRISISSDEGGSLSLDIPTPWSDLSGEPNDNRVEILLDQSTRDRLNQILDPKYETLVSMDSAIFTSLETGEANREINFSDFWHLFIYADDSSGHDGPEFIFEGLSDNQIWYTDSVYSFQIILEDTSGLDLGEQVGIDENALPAYITLKSRGIVAGKYILSLDVSPSTADTGAAEIHFTLFGEKEGSTGDVPENEKLTLIKKVNILKSSDTPPFQLLAHTSGGAIKLGYSDVSGNSHLKLQEVQYKLIKNGNEIIPREKREFESFYYPLGDGIYDVSCRIMDVNGNQYNLNKSVEISGVSNRKIKAGQWEMLGILGKNISTDTFGQTKTLAWWKDDAKESNLFSRYLLDGKIPFLERGKGYWVFSENDYELLTPDSNFLDSSISVKLVYGFLGWNQISNPFPYSIDVSSSGLVFYAWDAETADVINVNGILTPGEAYWVNVEKEQQLIFSPRPYFKDGSGTMAKSAYSEGIRFSLSAKGKTDNYNFLHIKANESSAPMNLSHFEAPKMGSHISLYFKGKKGELKKLNHISTAPDNRGDILQKFFVKSTDFSGTVSSLSLEGLDKYIQNGYHALILYNRDVLSIPESKMVSLNISSKEKEYTLVLTKNPDFKADVLGTRLSLSNYPNPVRNVTSIAFTLPYFEPGTTNKLENVDGKIEVYNIYGRIVAEINLFGVGYGTHEIKWIPQDTMGKFLPAGSYFYQLKIASIFKSRKMLIISN